MAQTKESLLKGKDQYSRPPYTNQFRSAAFHAETIVFLQNSYIN